MEAVCHINKKFVYTFCKRFVHFLAFVCILVLAPNKIIMFIYRDLYLSDSSCYSKQEMTFWLKCKGDETFTTGVCDAVMSGILCIHVGLWSLYACTCTAKYRYTKIYGFRYRDEVSVGCGLSRLCGHILILVTRTLKLVPW